MEPKGTPTTTTNTLSQSAPWKSALGVGIAVVILSIIAIEPPTPKEGPVATDQGEELGLREVAQEDTAGTGAASDVAQTGQKAGAKAAAGSNLQCKAGQNGGGTDKGISGNRIRLASTNVRSGTGSSFLGSSYIGMQAVVNRVNAAGGVCGRLLDLRLVDDGWEAARGANFLANFIKEDYFALPVVPSSEGLTQAILNKTISNSAVPVVGSDGMLKEQYQDPWVWPVAASTVSTIRIMTKHAWDNGARSFGIVYDQQYKFGIEGAAAFKQYVNLLSNADPKAFIGITPRQSSYSGEAQRFNEACGSGGCDFVAMLLTPETANTYITSQTAGSDGKKQGFGKVLTGGAQPLFNERFARDCGRACDGMLVWTGYNPPIGRLSSEKDVAAYVDDVRSVDPGVDVSNQFLEGAYLGMKVFVASLEKVGPRLTRTGVRDVMNQMTYETTLSSTLTWRANQRFANLTAQPFRIVTSSGQFTGFSEVGTGFMKDPTPGVVPK